MAIRFFASISEGMFAEALQENLQKTHHSFLWCSDGIDDNDDNNHCNNDRRATT